MDDAPESRSEQLARELIREFDYAFRPHEESLRSSDVKEMAERLLSVIDARLWAMRDSHNG